MYLWVFKIVRSVKGLKQNPVCNPLYYYGERQNGVILSRIRMRCSNLTAHLYDMKIIKESACACGYSREDEYHYFFICPLYHRQRALLHGNVSQFAVFNLHTILYGRENISPEENHKILDSVFTYIKLTKRFE